ncbi:MAG: OsmC family protein [Candidatus Limnocylindria bacterium]
MSEVGQALTKAIDHLKEHPAEARYTDSAAVAKLERGLRVTVTDPTGRSITTDMSKGVGGGDTAPSPGWLFRASLAACDTTLIAMRAAMVGVELTEVEVTIDSESNDHGILGIDDHVPAGPLGIRAKVRAKAKGLTAPQLRDVVEWAVAHCPVCDAAKRAVPMTLEIEV